MNPNASERDLQTAVVQLARIQGWQPYHTWTSIRSEPGFPDLVLIRPPQILVVELKSATGKVTAAQRKWLDLFAACSVPALVVRPADFEELAARLAGKDKTAMTGVPL